MSDSLRNTAKPRFVPFHQLREGRRIATSGCGQERGFTVDRPITSRQCGNFSLLSSLERHWSASLKSDLWPAEPALLAPEHGLAVQRSAVIHRRSLLRLQHGKGLSSSHSSAWGPLPSWDLLIQCNLVLFSKISRAKTIDAYEIMASTARGIQEQSGEWRRTGVIGAVDAGEGLGMQGRQRQTPNRQRLGERLNDGAPIETVVVEAWSLIVMPDTVGDRRSRGYLRKGRNDLTSQQNGKDCHAEQSLVRGQPTAAISPLADQEHRFALFWRMSRQQVWLATHRFFALRVAPGEKPCLSPDHHSG